MFDGNLPVTIRGAGSKRLLAMAIHKAAINEGAVILIDEIENSLEPYRLRHLIRHLRPENEENHQIICTTHSPIVVVECKADELFVVNSTNGITEVINVGMELQSIVRSIPESFLSRKIIICEGKTETGFLLSLDKYYWCNEHKRSKRKYFNLAEAGVIPIESPNSGGSEAPKYAVGLAKLHYHVSYFGDSDRDLNPSEDDMYNAGVEKVFLWEGGVEIERRICFDLPFDALEGLIRLAFELADNKQSFIDKVKKNIPEMKSIENIEDLIQFKDTTPQEEFRNNIGIAADNGSWFKRRDKGEELGKFVADFIPMMESTSFMSTINQIELWCYE